MNIKDEIVILIYKTLLRYYYVIHSLNMLIYVDDFITSDSDHFDHEEHNLELLINCEIYISSH